MSATLTQDPVLTNLWGPLGPAERQRLHEVLHDPRQYWDRDYGLILRDGPGFGLGLTLWQAVLKVDPTFPKQGPATNAAGEQVIGWLRYPDSVLIGRAIRYAIGGTR